nr:hypothetical protein [uncultured Flavobacterium sp.]
MFKNPLDYKQDDINEVMNIPIKIDIGKWESNDITETVEGIITNCTLASNHPHLPASFRVQTEKGEKILSIIEMKRFRQ